MKIIAHQRCTSSGPRRMGALLAALSVCATALVSTGAAAAAEVAGVRMWSADDRTRVVLDLSGPANHELMQLSDPDRVVVDLPGVALTAATLPPAQGFVRALRTGAPKAGTLRVVLDLTQEVKPRSFAIGPGDRHGHRLVIDLMSPDAPAPAVKAQTGHNAREIVVAISPGHGGHDPGASGQRGTREKDVVLAIGRRLKAHLDARPGLRGVLVRDGDVYVDHRARMRRARDEGADMFVAIHADAFPDKRAHGSTVYILSERGASSEAARWLADQHNSQDLIGGVSLDDKEKTIAEVLLDLSQTATLEASAAAGQQVIRELGGVGQLRRSRVQQAGFLVLKSPDIPSILVETAFISNPEEERRLASPGWQDKWGRAIADGIQAYFEHSPPPGTLLAQRQQQERPDDLEYVISRGDTLSEIADRFNVPLSILRQANRLRDDRIRIGQKLRIPHSRG